MKRRRWLSYTILRVASWLVPAPERAEWLRQWHSELWHYRERNVIRFCLGAFRDALWLRQNNLNPSGPGTLSAESPYRCLARVAGAAALSILIAFLLPPPPAISPGAHLTARDLPDCLGAMLFLSSFLLPATLFTLGPGSSRGSSVPWPSRLLGGIFLLLKLALIQPVLLGGFCVLIYVGPYVPLVTNLATCAGWILALRWVFIDQRRRCPVCLRLLTNPVRIGTPSETFLEWYGAESICARGHGFLQIPEADTSYSGDRNWLAVDPSWHEPLPEPAGPRRWLQ